MHPSQDHRYTIAIAAILFIARGIKFVLLSIRFFWFSLFDLHTNSSYLQYTKISDDEEFSRCLLIAIAVFTRTLITSLRNDFDQSLSVCMYVYVIFLYIIYIMSITLAVKNLVFMKMCLPLTEIWSSRFFCYFVSLLTYAVLQSIRWLLKNY